MRTCSKDMQVLEKRVKKLVKVMKDYYIERKKHHLRRWFRNAMSFVHENYVNQNLVRYNV